MEEINGARKRKKFPKHLEASDTTANLEKRFNALRAFGAHRVSPSFSFSQHLRSLCTIGRLKCLLHPIFIPTMVSALPRATMLRCLLANITSLSQQPLLSSLSLASPSPDSRGRNSQHLSYLLPPPPLIRSLGNSSNIPMILTPASYNPRSWKSERGNSRACFSSSL